MCSSGSWGLRQAIRAVVEGAWGLRQGICAVSWGQGAVVSLRKGWRGGGRAIRGPEGRGKDAGEKITQGNPAVGIWGQVFLGGTCENFFSKLQSLPPRRLWQVVLPGTSPKILSRVTLA